MKTRFKEPRVMRELHEIRERHYEETKHMTFEELSKEIEEKALKIMKEYNMNFKVAEPKH